jgi:DNA helicase-2/ATP-dependent DNA helicase PcrA
MVAPRQPEPPVNPFVNKTADSGDGLREGSVIEHQRFGIGTVVKLEGSGENLKATVTFRNLGTKQLLLKFARYKIVTR